MRLFGCLVAVCLERDVKVNTGDLSGQSGVHAGKQPKNRPAGVRAVIVAKKSGNAYSDVSRTPVPVSIRTVIPRIVRTVIPVQFGHLFRRDSDTCFQ